MPPVIVLLTDFGLADPYVGQMKGILLSLSPEAAIVDLSHEVPQYSPLRAGYFLSASARYFPKGSVFLCVVDPGVSGSRRIVCLEKDERLFLAPDNGLLHLVLETPGEAKAYDVTPPAQVLGSVVFQGRDIFAPLAARLAQGVHPSKLGPEIPLQELWRLSGAVACLDKGGLNASVLHIDGFGNVALNIPEHPWHAALKDRGSLTLRLGPAGMGELPIRLVKSYGELDPGGSGQSGPEIGLLLGSQGYLEIACNMASAAARLGLDVGWAVVIGGGCRGKDPGPDPGERSR